MHTFLRLVEQKKTLDKLKAEAAWDFSKAAKKCSSRKKEFHDGKDEWYRCTHTGYHLAAYTNITPCSFDRCPKLK